MKNFIVSLSSMFFLSSLAMASDFQEQRYQGTLARPLSTQKGSMEDFFGFISEGISPATGSGGALQERMCDLKNTVLEIQSGSFLKALYTKKSLEKIKAYDDIFSGFSMLTTAFCYAFDMHLKEGASPKNVNGLAYVPNSADLKALLKDYVLTLEDVTVNFLSIHNNVFPHIVLGQNAGILERKETKIGFFKTAEGYLPFPPATSKGYKAVPIIYGNEGNALQRQFMFYDGVFVKESGFYITVTGERLKIRGHYGEDQEYPYCCSPHSLYSSKGSNHPFIKVFRQAIGNVFEKSSYFIPLPSGKKDQDFVELLFLEGLLGTKESVSTEKYEESGAFLTFYQESEGEGGISLQKQKDFLEARLLDEYEQELTPNLDQGNSFTTTNTPSSMETSFNQKKQKVKTRGTPNKYKKDQKKSKYKEKKDRPAPLKEDVEKARKEHARMVFEQVKQEKRVKYDKVLKIMNQIVKNFSEEEVSNHLKAIFGKGSHNTLHFEGGTGVTLIRKHGRDDLTIPSKTVNSLSLKLINSLMALNLNDTQ